MRARPSQGRSLLFAAFLILAAASPVVGATGETAPPVPQPRVMERGADSGYRLPFAAGAEVEIAQGWNNPYSHNGRSRFAYDFGLYMGTQVLAAAEGVVTFTRDGDRACGGPELKARGNFVTIAHADGSATQYGHLSSVTVEVGDAVVAGQVIGRSGNSGFTGCMPHLHFSRQLQGAAVTQSIPIYFQGYEDREFVTGDVVAAPTACPGVLTAAKRAGTSTNAFCGSYYGGPLEGRPAFVRSEEVLDVDRIDGGPGGYWLDGDETYSARWVGRFDFASGWYAFRIEATGGVRVRLDGVVLVDDWVDRDNRGDIVLRQRLRDGVHVIEVEHFSTRSADRIAIDWVELHLDDLRRRLPSRA